MNTEHITINTGRKKPYIVDVTRQEMPVKGLPAELHGATLVHISDLHAGFAGLDEVYHEAVKRINALDPELILFTGDYIDDSFKGDYAVEKLLSRFRARQGIFGSIGNHDYRRGVVGTRRKLEHAGIRVLNNEGVRLDSGLWIAGVDDAEYGKPDLKMALDGAEKDATAIVMSHNPRVFEQAGEYNLQMLSGHTHGGQICPIFPTPKMVCMVHLRCRHVAGWYRNGRARLYVNRGLGVTGKPFRYRCHAEIAVFRLVPDQLAPERKKSVGKEHGEDLLREKIGV